MLIILKHAVGHLHVAPLLPGGPDCRAIVTARRDLPSLTGAYIIRLRSLGEEAALAMLTGIIGAERVAAEPEAARRIAGLCGGLPLALYVVGARLRAKPRWLLGLASRRLDTPHRLDELSHGYLDVRSRIHSAYLELDDDCRRAFVRLALLDMPEFTAQTAALALSLPENETEELLDGLLDARMLEVSACSRTGQFRYRFHELFRLFAHERLDDHQFTWTLHSGGPKRGAGRTVPEPGGQSTMTSPLPPGGRTRGERHHRPGSPRCPYGTPAPCCVSGECRQGGLDTPGR
jgi:NB-ARC domain-containing protein